MSVKQILVVGSLNMDQVVQVPRLPVLGETLLGAGSLSLVPGGKGANQAAAIGRLGGHVALAGRVGLDPFGPQLIAALQANHVQTELVVTDPEAASGVAFIFLSPEHDNAIIVASGANMRLGEDQEQLARIRAAFQQASALLLQLEIPVETVQLLIHEAHAAGLLVLLNAAPVQPLPVELLREVDLLIVNETEALTLLAAIEPEHSQSPRQITSPQDAQIIAGELQAQGIPTVAITLGSQGALLAGRTPEGRSQIIYQAAPRVEVVDTTAAGDCFVGALALALTETQLSLQDALHFAVDASALKVTRFGAQSGLPTRAELQEFQRSQA